MKLNILTGKRCFITLFLLLFCYQIFSQNPLFSEVLVSDIGVNNTIGSANTTRNLAIDQEGHLYVAFSGSSGIRVAKSTDRGASFLPSISITDHYAEPEIVINDEGIIFIAWTDGQNIFLSKSLDKGHSFKEPVLVGNSFNEVVHMTTFQDNIYLVDKSGSNIYWNNANGDGDFLHTMMITRAYADIRTDQNGTVYFPADDPKLYLLKSEDFGLNYSPVTLNPPGNIYYSSYALSDGPCGTFIFVAGGSPTNIDGFKIDVSDGTMKRIALGDNSGNHEGRTLYADNRGTLIDGYRSANGNLMMNVSYDQGESFTLPIKVAKGNSHNITRNPLYDDVAVVYEKQGSIYVSVYNNLLKNIRIPEQEIPTLCAGDSFELKYELSGSFEPGTTFSVFLSDATGSFEQETQIGTRTTNKNGGITITIPDGIVSFDAYRIQIKSEINCVQSNSVTLPLGALPLIQPAPLKVCEDDSDGIVTYFDTSNVEKEVLNGLTGVKVRYFDSQGNALPNPLPNPYKNLVPYKDEIKIRVYKPSSTCFSETVLHLEVYDTPQIKAPDNLYNCNLGSGFSNFDTSQIKAHLSKFNTDLIVTYSDENGNPLPNPLPTIYENKNPWSETITVKVANRENPQCYTETSFDLVVNKFPDSQLEKDYLICALDTSFYLASDTDFDTWQWRSEDGTLVSTTFDAELTNEGLYSLKAGKEINGIYCEKDFSFTLTKSQLPKIKEIRITELSNDNSIEVLTTGNGDFEYSIDDDTYQKDAAFHNLIGGVYNVTIRDIYGCGKDSKEVIIVDYPKFFTPNNDGANDFWHIYGIEKYPNAITYIFNRYGKLLRQLDSKDTGWDGMLNGKPLMTSDYWFRVELNETKNFNGHFSLKR